MKILLLSFWKTKRKQAAKSYRESIITSMQYKGKAILRKRTRNKTIKRWTMFRPLVAWMWVNHFLFLTFIPALPGTTDRDMGKLTWVRILTFCQLLPVFPGSLSLSSGVNDPILATRKYRGRKITFPPSWMVRAWLRSLFSRTPHKWISLSRLKLFHCAHCKSRFSLVSLTCLFSLKTTLYSLETSHWMKQSSWNQTG